MTDPQQPTQATRGVWIRLALALIALGAGVAALVVVIQLVRGVLG